MTTCQARQYSDQMLCGKCGLAWDVNDQDRPKCRPDPAQEFRNLMTRAEIPAVLRKFSARLRSKS